MPVAAYKIPVVGRLLPVAVLLAELFAVHIPLILGFLPMALSRSLPRRRGICRLPLGLAMPKMIQGGINVFVRVPGGRETFSSQH